LRLKADALMRLVPLQVATPSSDAYSQPQPLGLRDLGATSIHGANLCRQLAKRRQEGFLYGRAIEAGLPLGRSARRQPPGHHRLR
jgi:hypothetical protein